jgi:hypothetical protein
MKDWLKVKKWKENRSGGEKKIKEVSSYSVSSR